MSNSNDLRVLKTKKKLVSALNELMEKSPLVDITVFDLCQAANIRRATFYKHFSDKTDFLTYYMTIIEDGIFEKINSLKATGGPTHYYTSYVRELMRCLCDHETVLRGLIESDSLHLVMNIILSGTLESLKKDLAEDVETPRDPSRWSRWVGYGGGRWRDSRRGTGGSSCPRRRGQ